VTQEQLFSTKVLVAEQHQVSRLGLRALLSDRDNVDVVGEAQDARTAIHLVNLLQPHVILLDLGAESVDTVRKIRCQSSEIQIVALLALCIPEMFDALNDAGVTGYGLKDIDAHSLCTAISAVKRGDVWIDNRITCRLRFGYECVSQLSANTYMITGSAATADSADNRTGMSLSERELDILRMIAGGITNREIAQSLFISVSTVKLCIRRILEKLEVEDRTEAAVVATKRQLI
jgi:DNA-binding NarL/FixJ family response regulator